jgi:predicted Zn-dependent protease
LPDGEAADEPVEDSPAMSRRRKLPSTLVAWLFGLAIALGAPPAAADGLFNSVFGNLNVVSKAQEAEIGQRLAHEVESQNPMFRDAETEDFVADVGERLVRALRSPDFRYHFRVVADRSVNAFGIGGGYIYLNAGTIAAADTEGEVAAVLAHEIGHQVKRHVAKQISRQTLFEGLARLAVGPNASQWIDLAASLGVTTGQAYFGREAEREADSVMVSLLPAAGYDPREALAMFAKLRQIQGSDPGMVATIFSSHPPTAERSDNVRRAIASLRPSPNLQHDSSRFHQVRDRVLSRISRR